jgi:hypothetical protein
MRPGEHPAIGTSARSTHYSLIGCGKTLRTPRVRLSLCPRRRPRRGDETPAGTHFGDGLHQHDLLDDVTTVIADDMAAPPFIRRPDLVMDTPHLPITRPGAARRSRAVSRGRSRTGGPPQCRSPLTAVDSRRSDVAQEKLVASHEEI